MLNNIEYKSPIKSEAFIWAADYGNSCLLEYDKGCGMGAIKHDFEEIDKVQLINFGLVGQDMCFDFNIDSGIFDIFGNKYSVEFNGFNFMTIGKKRNDLIMYRTVESVLGEVIDGKQVPAFSRVIEYGLGYKIDLDTFTFKMILHLPLKDEPAFFTIRVVSQNDISGDFKILKNNVAILSGENTFKANVGKELKWIIR